MAKTTTFYIKCSAKEAAAIRAAAKDQQRTIHSYLRVVAMADLMKKYPNTLYPPLECKLCGMFMKIKAYPPGPWAGGYAYSHPDSSCERSEKWFAGQPHGEGCLGLVELPMESLKN